MREQKEKLDFPVGGHSTQPVQGYFVIVSPSYGGAERRFLDIFLAMRSAGHRVVFVAPSLLLDKLYADGLLDAGGRSDVLSIPLEKWNPLKFIRHWWRILRTIPRGCSFHYPMNCLWPLHILRGDRVTMSITNCISPPAFQLRNRTGLWTRLSMVAADRVDVLSPAIFKYLSWSKPSAKLSLTPGGTFIGEFPVIKTQRRPMVGFLGRFVPFKGIDDWLDVLPELRGSLAKRGHPEIGFAMAGYGPLQDHVAQRVDELCRKGVNIELHTAVAATEFLPSLAVTVSMQEVTNYPSRVVAEALISGSGVLVRDTGDSRNFGDLDGLEYCPPTLDPEIIAEKLVRLVEEVMTISGRSDQISENARLHFGASATVSYFAALFAGADAPKRRKKG